MTKQPSAVDAYVDAKDARDGTVAEARRMAEIVQEGAKCWRAVPLDQHSLPEQDRSEGRLEIYAVGEMQVDELVFIDP